MDELIYFEGSKKCQPGIDSIIRKYHLTLKYDDGKEKIYKNRGMLLSFHKKVGFLYIFDPSGGQTLDDIRKLLYNRGECR